MQQSSPKLVTSVRPGVYKVRSGALRKSGNPYLQLHLCSTTTTTTTKDRRGSKLGLALRGGWCLLGEWRSSTQQQEDAESKEAGDMKRSLKADETDLGSCPAGRELGSSDEGLQRAESSQALRLPAYFLLLL